MGSSVLAMNMSGVGKEQVRVLCGVSAWITGTDLRGLVIFDLSARDRIIFSHQKADGSRGEWVLASIGPASWQNVSAARRQQHEVFGQRVARISGLQIVDFPEPTVQSYEEKTSKFSDSILFSVNIFCFLSSSMAVNWISLRCVYAGMTTWALGNTDWPFFSFLTFHRPNKYRSIEKVLTRLTAMFCWMWSVENLTIV